MDLAYYEDDDDEPNFERSNEYWSENYIGFPRGYQQQRKYKKMNHYIEPPVVQYTNYTSTPVNYSPMSMRKSKSFYTKPAQKPLHPSNEFVAPYVKASYKNNPKAIFDEIIQPNSEGFGGLYLSDLDSATDLALIETAGIGAVLTLMIETEVEFPSFIASKNMKIDDLANYNILPFLNEAFKFIDFYRTQTNVLVHCFAGISRSPTVVMAYIMKHLKCDYDTAFNIVKQVRKEIDPNHGFIEHLRALEEQLLYGRNMNQMPQYANQVAAPQYTQPASLGAIAVPITNAVGVPVNNAVAVPIGGPHAAVANYNMAVPQGARSPNSHMRASYGFMKHSAHSLSSVCQ